MCDAVGRGGGRGHQGASVDATAPPRPAPPRPAGQPRRELLSGRGGTAGQRHFRDFRNADCHADDAGGNAGVYVGMYISAFHSSILAAASPLPQRTLSSEIVDMFLLPGPVGFGIVECGCQRRRACRRREQNRRPSSLLPMSLLPLQRANGAGGPTGPHQSGPAQKKKKVKAESNRVRDDSATAHAVPPTFPSPWGEVGEGGG